VVVDPYTIGGVSLAKWTRRAIAYWGLEASVKIRKAGVGAGVYDEIASFVGQRTPTLVEFSDRTRNDHLSDWAERVRTGGLEYQFERFANCLRTGTLEPVMQFARRHIRDRSEVRPDIVDNAYEYLEDLYENEEQLLRQESMQDAEAWRRSSEEGWYYAD
jgi:hypothetical protein